MKKRILTFVLSLVMILSCVMTSAVVVSAEDKITATENWYDEDATKLYISSPEDLLAFASVLYDGHNTGKEFEGKTVYLTKDITLNTGDASTWGTTPPTNNYNSFKGGSSTGWFKGTFDGQGYVISGLYQKTNSSGVGFIPYACDNATIKNVTITNSYFECSKTDGGYAAAVTCQYKAETADATFTVENVHVEDTHVIGNYWVSGVMTFMNSASVTDVKINMNNVTFVGGEVTGGPQSGGIIGSIIQAASYDCGVTLTMDKIVVNSNLTFTNNSTETAVMAGGVIGYVSGFRKINMTNIMVNGSLTIVGKKDGSTPFIGQVTSNYTQGTVGGVDEIATIDITEALAAPQMTNVHAYLCVRTNATTHPVIEMRNICNDMDKVGSTQPSRKVNQGTNDFYPGNAIYSEGASADSTHKYHTADLIGKQLFDGWMVADANSYPVPTANSVRLIGYQSSYATDVKDANNDEETYSIRLIAALNDTFYTTAGFEGISISYVKAGETEPTVVPKDAYTCKYAYKSVKGVNKAGAEEIYEAKNYYADAFIALEITGIPEDVTTFTITLNAFAGKDDVTFDGITRTVQISAQ